MKNRMMKVFYTCAIALLALLPQWSKAQSDTLVYNNFNLNCVVPTGWSVQNVDGDCSWRCDYGGYTQNNHSSQGCNGSADDWLITPKVDLDQYINEVLSVKIDEQYSGNALAIKFSNTYPGTGNPNSYSWTVLGTYAGSYYGTVSLSSYTGQGYVAFHYTSSGNGTGGAARFTINEVMLTGDPAMFVANPIATNISTNKATIGANVISAGTSTITGRGIVWSTSANPIIGGPGVTKINISGTLGAYDTAVTGLPSGTKIYYKGFVTDGVKTAYTAEAFFYTLSPEPAAYPASFTATSISKNSIQLKWSSVADAKGYLVLQRIYQSPTGLPADATKYTLNQTLGDGTVAAFMVLPTDTTITINNLFQGTRYFYTLFPYNYNLVNNETFNYLTGSPVPAANDSTWGYPPSRLSTVEGVGGTGTRSISSIVNDATITDTTKGALVWRLQVKDGGSTLSDADDLPTIVTTLTFRTAPKNIPVWSTVIQAASLFDDSTGVLIKTGTVSGNTIVFSGLTLTAQDNNYKPFSLRISLKKIAHTDKNQLQFKLDSSDVAVKTALESSQLAGFTSSTDTALNKIDVIATKLSMVTTMPTPVEEGAYIAQQQVAAVDTLGARDLDYTGTVSLASITNNIIAGPRTANAIAGLAAFDTVRFSKISTGDTLWASATGLTPVKGTRFTVEASKRSDIVADVNFVYPQNIKHLNYKDSGNAVSLTNSLEVFSLYLRDGGATGDPDFETTTINSLSLSIGNPYLLSKAALYANGSKIAELSTVSATALFNGFSVTANDNDSVRLSVRVTFKDSAVDGHRLTFTVIAASALSTGSVFAASNAGGAVSSTSLFNNVIDVAASRLVFVKQPVNVARGSVLYPSVTVKAVDRANNIDISGRAIVMDAIGSTVNFSATKTTSVIPVTGLADFSKLIFDVPNNGVRLVARAAGVDSALSDTFSVLLPVWFRSAKTGNWSDVTVWQYSLNFGATWVAATFIPDCSKHGYVTIQNGHTVTMDGTTAAANTVDEVTVENGAVLITPVGGANKMTVNDAFGDDILVQGKLLHTNSQSIGGLDIKAPATIRIAKGATLEMAAFGDAADWAGNSNIIFEDGAAYVHNTTFANTISPVTMFPNAGANVPVFRIAQNSTFPGPFIDQYNTLTINGLLSVDSGKTFTIAGDGERLLRNGITGGGDVVFTDSGKTRITGTAELSGNGKIMVNSATSLFQVAATSNTTLKNNKTISTAANNSFSIAGKLDGLANSISGNVNVKIEAGAIVTTAHSNGLDGLFATTGSKTFNAGANYVFNGASAQNSGTVAGNMARTITVNNANGLMLTSPITVSDSLYLLSGKVTTSTASLLTVNGEIMGYSTVNYINGPLQRSVDSAETLVFPLGKSIYAPVNYTAKDADVSITLEYIDNSPNANGYDTAKRGDGLAAVKAGEYWKIAASNPVNGRVEIPYTSKSATGSVDPLNIRVVSWNGTKWTSEGPLHRTATASSVSSDNLDNYTFVTIGIDSACTVPVAPVFNNLIVCDGKDAILTATGTGIRWFGSMDAEVPFATGNAVSVGTLSSNTVYYTEAKSIGCVSNRLAYPVSIQAIPAIPVVSGNTALCYNQVASLSADTLGTHNWYGDVNAATPQFTGDVMLTSALKNDTSFYTEKVINGCASPRTRVDVSVRAQIIEPFSTGAEVCAGTAAVVKAVANEDIHWFAANTAQAPFFTGEKYTTLPLFNNVTYYLEAFEGNCKSSRIPVAVTVNTVPAAPALTQPSVCMGTSAKIDATASDKVLWYNDNTSIISVDSGASFNTPALLTAHTYYAEVFNGKCRSPRASAVVSVFSAPQNVSFTVAANVGTNQATLVQTTTIAQNYEWNFGADAVPQTATGMGPHNVHWTSQGTRTITLKAWNGNSSVECGEESQSKVNVVPGTGIGEMEAGRALVYPNPINSGELNIDLTAAETAGITVTDATGRTIWKGAMNGSHTTVNVDGWAAGIYFINISTQNGNQSLKITKQ